MAQLLGVYNINSSDIFESPCWRCGLGHVVLMVHRQGRSLKTWLEDFSGEGILGGSGDDFCRGVGVAGKPIPVQTPDPLSLE